MAMAADANSGAGAAGRRGGKSKAAFRTISEVADELDVAQHVLRFWETKFHQIRPLKRGGGRRYYRPEDIDLLRNIKHLLYTEGYTIKGVQRLLRQGGVAALQHAIDEGRVQWHQTDVAQVVEERGARRLRLSNGRDVVVERVLLATGFASRRPGGPMLDDLIESASLPCAECGYPIVDRALRWHPRVYVSGPLAELELGPTARNIAGARRAGERIVFAARANAGNTIVV